MFSSCMTEKEHYYDTLCDLGVLLGRWVGRRLESVYLFPNLRQAVAVDAQVPLAEVTERCRPDDVGGFAEALRDGLSKGFSEIGGGGLAAKVSEGVNNDVLEVSFVGQPLDVLQRLSQDRGLSVCFFVGLVGVDEDNDCIYDLFVYVLIRYLG